MLRHRGSDGGGDSCSLDDGVAASSTCSASSGSAIGESFDDRVDEHNDEATVVAAWSVASPDDKVLDVVVVVVADVAAVSSPLSSSSSLSSASSAVADFVVSDGFHATICILLLLFLPFSAIPTAVFTMSSDEGLEDVDDDGGAIAKKCKQCESLGLMMMTLLARRA